MNQKFLLRLVSFFLLTSVSLYAQPEPDITFEESKEVKNGYKVKKMAIGMEGGWNQSFRTGSELQSYGALSGHTVGTGRLGINIMAGKMTGKVMPKYTWDTGIGYIFIDSFSSDTFDLNGWGLYFHGALHRNFRIKNSPAYFYTGYGFGLDMSGYNGAFGDMDIQIVRLPLGFKFLLGSETEIFLEANFAMGLTMTTFDMWFSMDTDFKGGVRFWI